MDSNSKCDPYTAILLPLRLMYANVKKSPKTQKHGEPNKRIVYLQRGGIQASLSLEST